MNEMELHLKWFPDNLEASRAKRMQYERGRFINCRHYKKLPEDKKFICGKEIKERHNCHGCTTCPNCDGSLAFYGREETHRRDAVYYRMSFTCIHCGAFIEEQEMVQQKTAHRKDTRRIGECEVEGCPHTAYEGRLHNTPTRIWLICESHHRKIRTWRSHQQKGPEQIPVIELNGKLYENQDYRIKQTKKAGKNGSQ